MLFVTLWKLIQAWGTIHPQRGRVHRWSILFSLNAWGIIRLANVEESSFTSNHSCASNFLSKTDHVKYSAASESAHLQTS